MKNIITIAGSGSGYTPGILLTALSYKDEFPIKEIRLYDIDEERNEQMRIIMDYLLHRENVDVELIATSDPQVAFYGCNFVFSQIRAGGMKMREMDEKIPLKLGLVGQETCGLGGFAYGMRSMKSFVELVGFIQEYAPDAWILNYTNPESIIAETVRRRFPKAKIINACDMTIGIEELLENSFGYDRQNFISTYYGLNHFGWYREIYDVQRGKDIKIVEEANPDYTRANEIMDGRLKQITDTVSKIKEKRDLETINYQSGVHGQYIVRMAISILHSRNDRFMLIVPNRGAIPNVREDAVVEVPCYVNAKGVEPISLRDPIPDFHKGLMEAQVAAEKLLVDAFFEHSYQKAFQAFTLNQTVPNATVAKQALDEMIKANGDQWVELKGGPTYASVNY